MEYIKMDPKVKKIWVRALRKKSNNRQIKNKLGINIGNKKMRCCLGVLMDEAVKAGVIPEPSVGPKGLLRYPDQNCNVLTDKVAIWAGLTNKYGGPINNPIIHEYFKASVLNDENDWNFDQIADAIEKNL